MAGCSVVKRRLYNSSPVETAFLAQPRLLTSLTSRTPFYTSKPSSGERHNSFLSPHNAPLLCLLLASLTRALPVAKFLFTSRKVSFIQLLTYLILVQSPSMSRYTYFSCLILVQSLRKSHPVLLCWILYASAREDPRPLTSSASSLWADHGPLT